MGQEKQSEQPPVDANEGANGLDSPDSMQSSIIKPHVTDSDMKFFTHKMFARNDALLDNARDTVTIPGSNTALLINASTWDIVLFNFRRTTLRRLHSAYGFYLQVMSWVLYARLILEVYIWWFVDRLGIFPHSLPTQKDNISPPLSQFTSEISKTGWLTTIRNLPRMVGNHALSSSLANAIPQNKLTIRQALGGKRLPQNLFVIYELNPLVVPPPPEMPTPYLTAEKKIVVPDKKETSRVLSERAEWAAAHHTHKASEVIRVCTESARLVSWAVYSGVKSLTIYEKSGNSWKDLHRLSSMIQTQIAALNDGKTDHKTWIKLVNVGRNESITIDDTEVRQHTNSESPDVDIGLESLEPTPISAQLSSQDHELSAVYGDLTVTLVSEADGLQRFLTAAKSYLEQEVKGETSNATSIDSVIDKELNRVDPPDLVLKFARQRSFLNSLDGAPIYSFERGPLFVSQSGQTNFPFFVKALDYYSTENEITP